MDILFAILGGVFNRVRGSNFPMSRYVNALAFAGLLYFITFNLVAALLAAIGMFAGTILGWGKYLGALSGIEQPPLDKKGVVWVQKILKKYEPEWDDEKKEWKQPYKLLSWGIAGTFIRGGVLWAPFLCLPVMYLGGTSIFAYIGFCVSVGMAMVASYYTTFKIALNCPIGILIWIDRKIGRWKGFSDNEAAMAIDRKGHGWEYGEILFGAVLWLLFITIFF